LAGPSSREQALKTRIAESAKPVSEDRFSQHLDAELRELLASAGAVVIEGPKACGKTTTASQQAASHVLLDIDLSARQVLAVDPGLLLEGARPRLLDEWQMAPELWNQVRRAVDNTDQPGQFVLTGSAVPADDASRHTGAGRFGFLRMRPMNLFETGASGGAVSLRELFSSKSQAMADPGLSIHDLSALKASGRAARDYLQQVRQVDDAAANLKRFAEQIDSQRSGSPAFLAVICGKGYGYRRADGVVVVPVGALGP
jgi:predicted AAA+ superfamily ATPase